MFEKHYSVSELIDRNPNAEYGIGEYNGRVIRLYPDKMALCDCADFARGRTCAHLQALNLVRADAQCIDAVSNGDRLYYHYTINGKTICTCKGNSYVGKCRHLTA